MGKVLSIDFGLKRTGLALSDDSKVFAFGLKTIESRRLLDEIRALLVSDKVDEIVIGEPRRMDMSDSHITENVRLLKQTLERQFPLLTIVKIDERFTSKMAAFAVSQSGMKKKDREQKGLIDEISATIILQDYLQTRAR
jgi:putative Holliday junction resolvase